MGTLLTPGEGPPRSVTIPVEGKEPPTWLNLQSWIKSSGWELMQGLYEEIIFPSLK